MKTQTPRTKRTQADIAHNQAGRAVVACLMGIPFSSITILADEPRRSRGTMHRYDEWPHWAVQGSGPGFDRKRAYEFIAREISMALAGPIIEQIFSLSDKYQKPRGENDEAYAFEITWDVAKSDEERHALVDSVRAAMTELLLKPKVWDAVEAVADRLQRLFVLSGPDVRAIVRKHLSLAPQPDERYSHEEARWCRVEDARLRAAGQKACKQNTHNEIRVANVLKRFGVPFRD